MNLVKSPLVYNEVTWSLVSEDQKPWRSPQINNFTFLRPKSPLLYDKYPTELVCNQEMLSKCYNNNQTFCECLHTLYVELDDVVEVVIADGGVPNPKDAENHVMHLHGYRFAVLAIEKVLIFSHLAPCE